jgi:hypothetical protein
MGPPFNWNNNNKKNNEFPRESVFSRLDYSAQQDVFGRFNAGRRSRLQAKDGQITLQVTVNLPPQ